MPAAERLLMAAMLLCLIPVDLGVVLVAIRVVERDFVGDAVVLVDVELDVSLAVEALVAVQAIVKGNLLMAAALDVVVVALLVMIGDVAAKFEAGANHCSASGMGHSIIFTIQNQNLGTY